MRPRDARVGREHAPIEGHHGCWEAERCHMRAGITPDGNASREGVGGPRSTVACLFEREAATEVRCVEGIAAAGEAEQPQMEDGARNVDAGR